ncbi:MAG: mechanosensitive ion channel [Eubacterium sp.]|nr:mechanosensitive ion channel [Eubacterium sp.]
MLTIETEDLSILETYLRKLGPSLINFALSVIGAVIVYAIGVRIIKWLRRLLKKVLSRHNVDEGVQQFLDAIAKVAGYFVLILMILGFFGVTTASVVAVLGSAGLTLGLALQGSLSNFAGGVLILLLKPFTVGDYIIDGTGNNEGEVKEISIFYTTLQTAEQKLIVIPNGTLANNSITNLTKSGVRRLDILVDIAYDADLQRAKQVLRQVAEHSTHRMQSEPVEILVWELAESSIKLAVRVWTTPDEYWDEKWELNEQIKLALDEAGIEIAFPQLDVHVR